MTEILTESFCERCGTRYTFESARPKTRLKGVKVFSRGLKNFVLSDDTSLDEAMAAARSETDREASAHQLDAFHKTFSFCMSCRQYTCPNCWNEAEARCLSCAPLALPEPPPIAETEPFLVGDATPVLPRAAATAEAQEMAEQYDDLRVLRDAVLLSDGEVEAEPANGTYAEAEESAPVEFAAIDVEAIDADSAADAEADAEAAALAAAEAELAAETAVALETVVPAETDVAVEIEAEAAIELADEAETPVEVEAAVAAEPEPIVEAPAATEDIAAASPTPDVAAGKAASQTLGLLRRFRPGQNLDAELAAFERERDEAAATVEPAVGEPEIAEAPLIAAEAETQPEVEAPPEVEAQPEPVVPAAAEAEPEAAAPTEPIEAEPEPAPLAAATAADVVEQPTWRITAPDPAGTGPSPAIPEAGSQVPLQAGAGPKELPNGEPQWPSRPQWPSSSTPAAGLPYLGRPATPQGGIEALWAASNQELVSAPQPTGKAAVNSIQPCVSCGLSLSATARFCRRCGTLQGR